MHFAKTRSKNIWLLIIVALYYTFHAYLAQLRSHFYAGLEHWTIAVAFWTSVALLRRRVVVLTTQLITIAAYTFVTTAVSTHSFQGHATFYTLSNMTRPLAIILYVILPAMFFVATVERFALVYDARRVIGRRASSYLVLIFSIAEMVRSRLDEVTEHLQVRGIDIRPRIARFRYLHIFLTPVLRAAIQEAAYRQLYMNMLGCDFSVFPRLTRPTQISPLQIVCGTLVLTLLALRPVLT